MSGTRGGMGRLAAMVLALLTVLFLLLAGEARAGSYPVAQCGWGVGAELDPDEAVTGPGFSAGSAQCPPANRLLSTGLLLEAKVMIGSTEGFARVRWVAPAGTVFAAVRGNWAGHLQHGFRQTLGADIGTEFRPLVIATGSRGFEPVAAGIPGGASAVELRLDCEGSSLLACWRLEASTAVMREVTLTLEDPTPPVMRIGGPATSPDWERGTQPLTVAVEDSGAGIVREETTIDGVPIVTAEPDCSVASIDGELLATKLQPCVLGSSRAVTVDTTKLGDGAHLIHGCATDFAGNVGCAGDVTLRVDNSPPAVDFTEAGEGEIAATVSDPSSGPASGTISVRRADADGWTELPTRLRVEGSGEATLKADLPALSAGRYLFRAVAADAAGNAGSNELRVAGSAAEIRRQAAAGKEGAGRGEGRSNGGRPSRARGRRRTRLVAYLRRGDALRGHERGAGTAPRSGLTIDYGSRAAVRGRLTGPGGAAVAGRAVEVVVIPARGASTSRAEHRVVTDRHGDFELDLPAGPSRHLVVSFPGGRGLVPSARRELDLGVRAAVSLTATPGSLRNGEAVRLRGGVRSGSAQIPGRGKLVAIQYLERDSGRWRPALVVRTGASGRFDTRYRFRYIHGAARIRLRATALPEQNWPYASGSSAPVTVDVDGSI